MTKKILLFSITILIIAGVAGFWFWKKQKQEPTPEITNLQIVDVNTHLDQDKKVDAIKNSQAIFTIVSPPPFRPNTPGLYDGDIFYPFIQQNKGFGFASGGGSLNIMIQKHGGQSEISEEIKNEFENQAKRIATLGAMAFGEVAALHLALGENHPFEEVAPDHPLFLLLSDLSARFNLPILFHMEAVDGDMKLPDKLQVAPNNPDTLNGNIDEFETLLDHNLEAKIIWLQAGWDHTGDRTTELMAELLDNHPNLYLGLKIGTDSLPETSPLDNAGNLKSEWSEFMIAYADKIVVASDNFLSLSTNSLSESGLRQDKIKTALSQLPIEAAEKIAYKNAEKIFNLTISQ
jgi:hypothetical protein